MKKIPKFITVMLLIVSTASLMIHTKTKRDQIIPSLEDQYPVAVSNLELDISIPNETTGLISYLDGRDTVYLTDILKNPDSTFIFQFEVPDDKQLYEDQTGKIITTVGIIVYPTSIDNVDDDYAINPGNITLTRMQKAGRQPLINDGENKYPLVIFSHGYQANPLYQLPVMERIAAQGYIVVALFHGDCRFKDFLKTEVHSFQQLSLRALSITKAIEVLENNKDFGSFIDFNNIGIEGISFGGITMTILMGGEVHRNNKLLSVSVDGRIKACSGYIPFLGEKNAGFWGKGFKGVKSIMTPFLAVSGETDDIASYEETKNAMKKMKGPKHLVVLEKTGHTTSRYTDKIYTAFTILFFNSYLKNDASSLELFNKVSGIERTPNIKIFDIK